MSTGLSVGFIGLGNVGAKLAGSILRAGIDLTVLDLDAEAEAPLLAAGARKGASPRAVAESSELLITCLPSPAVSASVMEGPEGGLSGLSPGDIWAEMSTTDSQEVRRLGREGPGAGGLAGGLPRFGRMPPGRHGQYRDLCGVRAPCF